MAEKFNVEVTFKGDIAPIKSSLNELQTKFSQLDLSGAITKNAEKSIKNLITDINQLEAASSRGFNNQKDVDDFRKNYERIRKEVVNLNAEISGIKGLDSKKLLPEDAFNKIDLLNKKVRDFSKELKNLSSKREGILNSEKDINYLEELKKRFKEDYIDPSGKLYKGGLKKQQQVYSGLITKYNNNLNVDSNDKDTKKKLREAEAVLRQINNLITKTNSDILKTEAGLKGLTAEQLKKDLDAINNSISSKTSVSIADLQNKIHDLTGVDIQKLPKTFDDLKTYIENLPNQMVADLRKHLEDTSNSAKGLETNVEGLNTELLNTEESARGFNELQQEIDQVSSRLKYFFSIANGFRILRSMIRDAVTTIKDLDAAMTETAVVTEYTVGDMWDQLPEYTKKANELGLATKDVYEASTLYYQQGLQTQQVQELTTSTLKLARIASLDAAEATDRMTNALRGFNMELNETNANRVADVYSELAAITASDVDEISVAMTKTASIAASAGMQFETTAAFLSQIIETTRESA